MSSTLDASVISAAGRRVGRGCSGIPLRPSERMLLRRELLWKKMQEKYTQMEKSRLSHKSIQINEIGDHDIQSLSTSCKEMVSQNTHIELPDESWENRHKYRKTMDSVQHWVNTSVHHPLSDSSDNIFPTHSEQVETDLPASGRESPLCNSFPDINSHVQEYVTSGKAVIKDVRNLDVMSGTSEEDQTLDELNLVKFMKQEEQPKKRKRLLRQENCSKNPDSESKTLITNKKHSRTIKDSNLTGCFISYNKSPVMSKKNAISGDKDNPLPEKLILKDCDKILMLKNGEDLDHSDKYTSVLRKETTLENHKSSTSILKDIPVCKKETLMDIRTQSEQNLSSDTEKSDENFNMYSVSVMEKPVLGCKLQKTVEGCDTDTTVSTVLFCDKKALTFRREINMNENDMRKKSLQLNHIDTPISQKGISAEKFNNSQTPRSGKILSSVSDARVAVIEEHVENCYTRPTIRMDDALMSRTEENLGDYSGSSILRKNKLLTIGKQVLLYTAEGTLKDLDHSSLSREEQLSDEDEEKESLESIGVQVLGNGRKDQTSGTDVLTYEDVRVPVAREQHCEQSETSRKEILQTPEPVESCIQIKGQEILSSKCVDLPTSDEDSVVYSLEDASTIMFNPLLSCKYEHFLPEIRKKLENLQENYKEKDRGGRQVTHSEGRTGHIYVCSKRNSVFADQRNKRNLDVSHHHPSYISETQGNSRDNKSYELTGDQQEEEEEESDTVNGNRFKDVVQYTSLQSEKEERANNSYDKISNSISQNMSITNKSNKESPKHSNKLLRFGTDKIKFNHCNSYDEDHGFEMNSKRETNPSLLSEYDENEAVMPDDDDDDIFCYRPPQHSSLHHERESNINKIFSLNTPNLSPRSTNYSNISGLRGKSEQCKSVRTMVGDGSHHSVTETPHLSVELGHDRIGNTMTDDGKNPEQLHVLTTKRKLTRSSNHSLGSECAEYEDNKADYGEITRKGFVLTKSKRKRETSDYLTGSSFSKTDSDNPTRGTVLTRVQSGGTSNKICSEHGKNEDIADGYKHIFSDDGGCLQKENVSSKCKGAKLSNHLHDSDNTKTEYHIIHDENPNKENVLTIRKRGTKASNNEVGSKHVKNEGDISNDGENTKNKSVLHKKEKHTKISNSFSNSGRDRNECMFATRRKTGRRNHGENEDCIFDKTHKRSLFDEKGKETTGSICDKEKFTLPKLNKTNKVQNSSQRMFTRNTTSVEAQKCLVKPALFEKEDILDSHSSDEDIFTDSYRKQFSGDKMKKGASSDKADNIHKFKMKSKLNISRTEKGRILSTQSEDLTNEIHSSSDDDIFYKNPRHLFCEKEKEGMFKICGNQNVTSQKSSKTNKHKSFKNNSSQRTLTRKILREDFRHPVKPVVFENKNTVDSEKTSIEIEDSLTDSYRQQFSEDVMDKVTSSDKFDDIRLKIEFKLESSGAEMQEGHLPTSKCLGNEKKVMGHDDLDDDDDNDDIFYYKNSK